MAEEFQAGICSGNWWNSSRSVLSTGLSPCSLAINNDIGCYNPWQTDMASDHHLKVARSCAEESNLVSDNSSLVFQDVHAPNPCSTTSSADRGSNLNYSNLQMMGYGLSSSSTSSNWNPSLLGERSSESNIHSMVEENMDRKLDYRRKDSMNDSQIQKEDWDMETFSSCANQVSPIDSFKPIAHQEFALDQQSASTVTSGTPSVAGQDSASRFPLASTNSYGSYMHSLFDADSQPQHSLFNNQSSNYSSTVTYATKDSSENWSKFSSFLKPSAPKQQNSGLVFANNTPFWNASAAALNDIRFNIFNSPQSPYVLPNEDKPNCPTSITKSKTEEARQDTESVLKKNTGCEPAIKRPRIETPSPLPTFKVRKEKLGDRITCLQQLVSPFGKICISYQTDTASVLHEAIEYIKFLHAQVNNFSAPYMKSGIPSHHLQVADTLKETEDDSKDLRSRGLCLVPISSTFPVANETTADFWTPSFGSTFR